MGKSWVQYFGLDKLSSAWKIIKHNGGIGGAFLKGFRTDDLKIGVLKGSDEYGNRYWENNSYFFATNRWIEYNPNYGWDYDGSQIPAEWYGWMHYRTDLVPGDEPFRPKYKWMLKHEENLSGTRWAYYPYSTTKPKVEAWIPPKPKSD